MATVERKREVFENVLRLRRVGRSLPGDTDLAAVRRSLERELGVAVSQRFAASTLGLSHTALSRWVKAGDLPIVMVADGRRQVPVSALLELVEAVRSEPLHGAGRHVLAPTMHRRRTAARRLTVVDVGVSPGNRHERSQARALAYHQAIAGRLRQPMVGEALHVLSRWRADARIDSAYADWWEHILALPLADVRVAIAEVGPDGDDLRQNSPFAGMLTEPERRRIFEQVT
jgi:hypothetical protein